MNLRTIWVIASTEIRTCRRLVRTGVFIGAALTLSTSLYISDVIGLAAHSFLFAPSGWIYGPTAPQYSINDTVFGFFVIFLIGIVFLCFDIRARDVQNRIRDVVESKPINNLEITFGRITGIFILLLVPMFVFLGTVTGYEIIAHTVGWSSRFGILTVSAAWSETLDVLLVLLFVGSLVVCLASLIRSRFLVAIVSLGFVLGFLILSNQSFVRFEEVLLHSDIAPVMYTPTGLGKQIALLLFSIGFLVTAAAFISRVQPRRELLHLGGVGCLFAGVVCMSAVLLSLDRPQTLRNEWTATHNAQSVEAFPDIQHLKGLIDIWPQRKIAINLTLTVRPSGANSTNAVLFSLNPGYSIQEVLVDGEEILDFSFDHGLLKISNSVLNDYEHLLRIKAEGRPNQHFAYLDQARNLPAIKSLWIPTLGTKNYIFHSKFVALMPSIKWYPTSGTAVHEDLLEHRPRDVFTTDLTVSVPKDWSVAMVGNRELLEDGKRVTYTFKTSEPVPEIALFGSNFERRGKSVEEIGFELLFSKKHMKNLDALAPYANLYEDWVAEQIRNARQLAFEYPHETFYVVEVPRTLRIYGGGWRMDSVLQPPGMMLLRETTLPTASISETFAYYENSDLIDSDAYALNVVLRYVGDDVQGGSPFAGISRNFVNHFSSPAGRGGTAINYLLEQLATQLIMKRESIFVPSLWEYGMTSAPADWFDFDYYYSSSATQKRLDIARTPSTWDEIERTPLVDLDFKEKPIPSFRAMLTKGYVLAQSMIEYYGAENVSAFLQRLNSTYQGQHYTLDDIVETASATGIDLSDWVLDWLVGTTLPGFVIGDIDVSKLNETQGSPYQTNLILHNAEPVPGYVQVTWEGQADSWPDPIFLEGHQSVEVAIQTSALLHQIWIKPYFAKNREKFPIRLPSYDGKSISDDPTKPLLSIVDWSPPDSKSIIVDDLDAGFSIVGQVKEKQKRFTLPWVEVLPIFEETADQGIPLRATSIVGEWERKSDPYSYSFGRYRHTLALIARGQETSYAKFVAALPHSGRWLLEYFVPGRGIYAESYSFLENPSFGFTRGILSQPRANPNNPKEYYRLQIKDGQSTRDEKFDIANAEAGWNSVGTFELSSDHVQVLVSGFAGRADIIVYADAIRWTPVDSE